MKPGGRPCPPGCMTRFNCPVTPSMTSTARALPNMSRPALSPRIKSCQAIEAGGVQRATDVLADRFLDAREVQDTFAQYRGLYLLEIVVFVLFEIGRALRPDEADELAVESVLNTDQGGGDLDESGFVGRERSVDYLSEALGLGLNVAAQLAQTQHAQGIADLAEHLDLGGKLFRLARATADEDIQNVFDLRQVLADRDGHCLHELHARCGQVLALLLDALVDRQQFLQTERSPHRLDAGAAGFGAANVIKKVVEQLDGRRLGVTRLALLVQDVGSRDRRDLTGA